ncbi:ABC transporter six-transmembrane domain-containing protein [Vibrio lentus]|nr:ABC transporter six-transmembrane domain-containing protein [Vibrio lentus]
MTAVVQLVATVVIPLNLSLLIGACMLFAGCRCWLFYGVSNRTFTRLNGSI